MKTVPGLSLLKEHKERSKEVKTSQIQDRAGRASLQGLLHPPGQLSLGIWGPAQAQAPHSLATLRSSSSSSAAASIALKTQ